MSEPRKIFVEVMTEPRGRHFLARTKKLVKYFLFFFTRNPKFLPYGGPDAVSRSLKRGLKSLGNKKDDGALRVAAVLSSPGALKEAIERKKQGLIDYIVAGPNVSHNPDADSGIICNENIDLILVPSTWTLHWWASLKPELLGRLRAWFAGVDSSLAAGDKTGKVVIYSKNKCPFELAIQDELKKKNISYIRLEYGHFTRNEYLKALRTAPLVIYLSQTESQGIALFEAWMSDVPTLVWNPGEFTIDGFHWKDEKMSAPYLTPETGSFFKTMEEFNIGLNTLLSQKISPRAYALEKYTNECAAKNYLELLK